MTRSDLTFRSGDAARAPANRGSCATSRGSWAMPPGTSAKVTARALRDRAGARLGRRPVMVPTYGPPGSTALMTAPDCADGVRALIPDGLDVPADVAARAPRGEVTLHPAGHFDIYVGADFERNVADQLGVLARHVPVGE